MSRDKGKRGERELAKVLRGYGFPARRGQQFAGGCQSPDVVGIPGVHIECKLGRCPNIYAAMVQSEFETAAGDVPVAFTRRDRGQWLLTVPLDRMDDLVVKWIAGQSTEQVGG